MANLFQVKKLLLQEGHHHSCNDFFVCDNKSISARRIDEYARFGFPLAFGAFNVAYWCYYLKYEEINNMA